MLENKNKNGLLYTSKAMGPLEFCNFWWSYEIILGKTQRRGSGEHSDMDVG